MLEKDRKSFKGHLKALFAIRYMFAPFRSKKRVVILTNGRSGSTLLNELLGSQAGVQMYGELFHYPVFSHFLVLSLIKRSFRRNQVKGFKLLGYQVISLLSKRQIKAISRLIRSSSTLTIYLHRESLDRAISNIVALERNVWHLRKKGITNTQSFEVSPERVEQELEREEKLNSALFDLLPADYFHISYDEDLKDLDRMNLTLMRLTERLGIPYSYYEPRLKKIVDKSVVIANKQELFERFSKNKRSIR